MRESQRPGIEAVGGAAERRGTDGIATRDAQRQVAGLVMAVASLVLLVRFA